MFFKSFFAFSGRFKARLEKPWRILYEMQERSRKTMRLGAKANKLPSSQFYDIMRFLEDNSDQENHYVISNINKDSQ